MAWVSWSRPGGGVKTLYVAFWFKHSTNWRNCDSGINKMVYFGNAAQNDNIINFEGGSVTVYQQNGINDHGRMGTGAPAAKGAVAPLRDGGHDRRAPGPVGGRAVQRRPQRSPVGRAAASPRWMSIPSGVAAAVVRPQRARPLRSITCISAASSQ